MSAPGPRGPVILSLGARPFFVLAALWAVVAIGLWPAVLTGKLALPSTFAPIQWHAHELIFGYTGAAMAGFVLTAVANWTGRPPVSGARLGTLVILWLVGRVAVACSATLPGIGFAALAFPALLAVLVDHQIEAAGNARNRKVVLLLAAFALADMGFHLCVWFDLDSAYAARGGMAILVLLILLVGGRVTPNFTRNWLKKNNLPVTIPETGRGDAIAMGLAIAGVIAWVIRPEAAALAPLHLLAGIATLWRLSRWQGWTIRRDALIAVLHLGYLFAGLGFLAVFTRAAWPDTVPQAMVIHVWAIGAIGGMTLAMMTRATLGHTGGTLRADRITVAAFLLLPVALAARLGLAWWPDHFTGLLHLAATAWVAAFVLFLVRYAPALLRRA